MKVARGKESHAASPGERTPSRIAAPANTAASGSPILSEIAESSHA